MVSTRASRARRPMATIAEEKKDDGEYTYDVVGDEPQALDGGEKDSQHRGEEHAEAPPLPARKSPLLLLLCAAGITSCYLWYGACQEQVFHMDRQTEGPSSEDKQSITLFMLATGTFSSFLLALIWTVIGPILLSKETDNTKEDTKTEGGLNHPLILLTSVTYLSAMAASNESLHYVSYPTCVLAKSSKLIPTMVVGWIVERWRSHRSGKRNGKSINAMEWIGAALITIGILSFQYMQLQKQSSNNHHDGKEQRGDSPFGLALLGVSLMMDGLLAACQSTLKQKDAPDDGVARHRPPSAMETMLYTNLYATILLLGASHCVGQLDRGMRILFASSGAKSALLLQMNLAASLGQVFIFMTIHHFSPLTCTTITTTRKFATLLLSVYRFGHVLSGWQWASIGLVFGGLYLEIAAKLFERRPEVDVDRKVKRE